MTRGFERREFGDIHGASWPNWKSFGVGADQVLEQQQDLLRSTVRRAADLPPADDRVAALGDLGEVSSIAAAALREEDPVSTRSGK